MAPEREPRKAKTPQGTIRDVIELCADCDTCRPLMEEDCAFFPELYRLWDREKDAGVPISAADLRCLVELCTVCGLCPCPRIPADLMEAKGRYIEEEGLPLATRLLIDVPRMARLCGSFPRLTQAVQSSKPLGTLLRKAIRIHPDRQLPSFPKQNFFQWAALKGLTHRKEGGRNVAYFAGCTAGYLFPQVGRAVVEVLERNEVTVYLPAQECCGIPYFVEGDRAATLDRVRANLGPLLAAIRAGDALVSSCPTCGYFMKRLLRERAYYSPAYQKSINAGEDEIMAPVGRAKTHWVLKKSLYKDILKDDGYFLDIDPMARIDLAEHLKDAGEFLAALHAEGRFDTGFSPLAQRMVYFAPCHQRELKIGSPYLELLELVPGLSVDPLEGIDCCGMGGNFGFKTAFHDKSLAVGEPLMARIAAKCPEAIITDCMSCALQFRHALPYPVYHPMEILALAYRGGKSPP